MQYQTAEKIEGRYPMETVRNKVNRKIVLIDDDPAFCEIMRTFAMSRGLELEHYSSLAEMGSIGRLSDYGVAIIDYDLGNQLSGIEIAEYVPSLLGDMPLVLISGFNRKYEKTRPWPKSIKCFVHKDDGPDAILDNAISHISPTKGVVYAC